MSKGPATVRMSGRGAGRRLLAAAAAAFVVAAAAGCGGSASDQAAGGASANGSSDKTTASGSAYPRSVPTRYGEVTIEQAPQRVVALSVPIADELVSLGIEPVAVAAASDDLSSSYPWMGRALDGLVDTSLSAPNGDLNLEAIARAKPDLVLAATWQITDRSIFEQLNEIAPTVIPDSKALNVDWDRRLLSTADAVDRTDRAKRLIASITAAFRKVGSAVPGVRSKTYQLVRADPDGFGFGNGSMLELFGLQPAANQDNTQNGPPLSRERTAELDADLLGVWAPTEKLRASLDRDPLFRALPAVERGTVFYTDLALADAVNTPAPMALRWARDRLAPVVKALG